MTKLRLLFGRTDIYDTASLKRDGPSYIKDSLPKRAGARPTIMPRILPQRTVPEYVDPKVVPKLQSLMKTMGAEHPEVVVCKRSHTEGFTTDGIYALDSLPTLNPVAKDRILKCEVAHAHPQDQSLHVWLSDADVIKVMEAGWGCRFSVPGLCHHGFIMVYAPRDEEELKTVQKIVNAGVAFLTGVEI
jgi:hypothetical protein